VGYFRKGDVRAYSREIQVDPYLRILKFDLLARRAFSL